MTKKDFEAIARAITEARALGRHARSPIAATIGDARGDACDDCAVLIADHCASDNPRFDRARFLKACGVQS